MVENPDIIFIVLDTHRADRLGCLGYKKEISPNIDNFAAKGILFKQAVSPAQWTIPSHASMFTGLYPTAHQVTQASQSLPPKTPHLAELLQQAGYETIGFCNNPLVGILNNGFKRGFNTFYNYGGAFPSVPQQSSRFPWPLNRLTESYTQFLRRISYPIQNYFGQSDLAFRISLNAWLTPIWSKLANFKGQNERSVKDVAYFLNNRKQTTTNRPLFLFLNLMETHMPFTPPNEFIDQVAPGLRQNKEARKVIQKWNREAYRWAAPLEEPLSDLESQVLNAYYDAEVAYQDHYLQQLFRALENRPNHENTLTIIVADHGDGLGEHGYMGHAFNAYQELVHVPLIMHWPKRFGEGKVVTEPVSTRRVFHTILDSAGRLSSFDNVDSAQVRNLSLMNTINGRDPEHVVAYSEIYPPLTFIKAIESRNPALLAQYECLFTKRAVVKSDENEIFKLIEVENGTDSLFNLKADPLELNDILAKRPFVVNKLSRELYRIKTAVDLQKNEFEAGQQVEMDDHLIQRLRGLGYLD